MSYLRRVAQMAALGPPDARGRPPATASSSGWPAQKRAVEIFWPILAAVLVVAVIFVSTVAHITLNAVGAPAPILNRHPVRVSAASATLFIVQISSHPTRAAAQAAAQVLDEHGLQTRILDSDDYRPLNPGYFVVYGGPYPKTAAGREDARELQAHIPGALLREIHAR